MHNLYRDMTNFEINAEVTKRVYDIRDWTLIDNDLVWEEDQTKFPVKCYCTNGNDALDVIIKNEISLYNFAGEKFAYHGPQYDDIHGTVIGYDYIVYDNNIIRAAMNVYLMMTQR